MCIELQKYAAKLRIFRVLSDIVWAVKEWPF